MQRAAYAVACGEYLVEKHGLEEAAHVYRILGMATLELALEAGLEPAKGDEIKVALTG